MTAKWYQEAVFYQLYIRAYADSNGDGHGDFRGAIEKLDHIQSLGVTCIWIMPHYVSPLLDDGYDIADYTAVHPNYGSIDDFKAFVDAAHQRGLRVVTDLVMNHTSSQHPWFQAARQDKNSPYRSYYVWSDSGTEYADTRIIFLDDETSNWTYDEVAGQYFWHRFYSSQPDLNYDNPQVLQEIFNVIRFWMEAGLDGFRADAVPYLIEREGTNCENLPETHAILKKVRRFMDEHYPEAVLIAEANQWPHDLLPYFGDGDEFHVCFHFPIMPRLYQSLKSGDKTPIVEILNNTPPIPAGTQWMTFLRNHDELTLEMVTPEVRQWMWEQYAPEPRMRQNLGIRRRLAPLLDNDKRRWFLLNAMFLSLPGTPIVYYGDEIGMGDNIWLPDRHGCRTPMQWDDGPNAGFSSATQTYYPVISGGEFDYQQVNVAAQEADPDSYLNRMRFLLHTRQSEPSLTHGDFAFVETGTEAIFAFRRYIAGVGILCLFNLTDQPQIFTLHRERVDLLSQDKTPLSGELTLRPFAAHWLK
jgi:maltose alpha-D-glucosyltransferase/alpha-amylase